MTDRSPAELPTTNRTRAMWIGILVGAAILRFHGLELRSLWHDEGMSAVFARLALSELPDRLRVDSGPPLYYVILHAWTALFGDSATALRAVSAGFGLALVAIVGRTGAMMFGERAGLAAALVCAVSPSAVYFSQEARAYTLLSVTVLVAWVFLFRLAERGRIRDWVGYSACMSAALLTHNYAFFVLGAQAAWVAVRFRAAFAVAFAGAAALVALTYLPWLPVFLGQLRNPTPVRWIEDVWNVNGALGSLLASFRGLSPGGVLPPPIGRVARATAAGVLAAGGYALIRRTTPDRASWLVLSAVGPLVLAAAYSSLGKPVYVPQRLDQVVVPAFCLLWGVGFSAIKWRLIRLAAATLTVGAALLTAVTPRLVERGSDDRDLAAAIAARAEPGALVIATSLTRPTLEYYLRTREDLEIRSFPAELAEHLGNRDAAALLEAPGVLEVEAKRLAAEIRSGRRDAWIAFIQDPVNEVLERELHATDALVVEEIAAFRLTVLANHVVLLRVSRAN